MSPTFLIVEDDPDARTLLEAILESYGCTFHSLADGQEAVEHLSLPDNAKRYDAIFLDLMMPRLSGHGVIRWLKEHSHTEEIPVIMLTAKAEGDDIINGYQEGADYYITKPFTKEQIAYGLDLVFGEEDANEEIDSSASS